MMSQYTLKFTDEQAREMPMVDLAFEILKSANTTFYYRDLMAEIAKIKGLSDDQIMQVIAQLYTEINIDGRFACVGSNLWGLKRWYPVEKSNDDSMGSGARPRIINDDDDDEDYYTEEEGTYGEEEYVALDAEPSQFDSEEEDDEFYEEEIDEIDEEIEDAEIDEVDEELGEELDEADDEYDDEEADDLDGDEDDK
ncbi:DNA-directed RNA polymerase subunit delta [Paenibacillus sp. y28]|uniref:DNA-directed RNA polymerase subunit delta n=1 Tax=Paenibacillus sp. y28 TaxID=3129110 RepID=UPI00301B6791